MPSRLEEYQNLLAQALQRGYQFVSIADFWRLICAGKINPQQRYFILRHDIDTDVNTAKAMWAAERSLDVPSTYYFRLCTVDVPFMQQIAAQGAEVGYHYEELAAIAKRRRLKTRDEVLQHLPQMARAFEANLAALRLRTGLPLETAASHGDFVNRRLGLYNFEILKDPDLRRRVGILLEAYDPDFTRHLQSRHSDWSYPDYWISGDPMLAINNGVRVINLLVHPRHWRSSIAVNLVDNVKRMAEGIYYRCPNFGPRLCR